MLLLVVASKFWLYRDFGCIWILVLSELLLHLNFDYSLISLHLDFLCRYEDLAV